MSVYIGDVQTFTGVIADKPQVLKIGEETMEVFSAWEDYKDCSYSKELHKEALVAEIADVIQAACNLLAAVGVDDMRQPMQVCYVRNSERGREYESATNHLASKSDVAKSAETDENATTKCEIRDFDDSREKLEADIGLFVARYMPKEDSPKMFEAVCSFLDRQVAITAIEVARERYDIERDLITARDELQEALNAAAGKWAKADARCFELQEQVDNQKKAVENFRDMWQKADTRCSELKAENEGLKARIESLRSKLSKMLDAASAIQHIGDLP